MKNKDELLKQVNIDIIFFFLTVVQALISFYIINEKKKSILNIKCMSNDTANKIYWYNRRLNVIICIYFFLNAYNNYQEATSEKEKEEDSLLVIATLLILIASFFYLPIGNSNLIIEN